MGHRAILDFGFWILDFGFWIGHLTKLKRIGSPLYPSILFLLPSSFFLLNYEL
jgi:hypothetical protein